MLCGITAKEADEAVRESLAEAVLCLARVDAARKQLWKCDAPTLLQKGQVLLLVACPCRQLAVPSCEHHAAALNWATLGDYDACCSFALAVCRYEYEENPTVCRCMEDTAELFLGDGFEPAPAELDAGATAEAPRGSSEPPASNSGSGRVVHIEEID